MMHFHSLQTYSTIVAKADSGASNHYFKQADMKALTEIRSSPFRPSVLLPDSTQIQATHSGTLPLHHSLSTKAKTAHLLDGITNASLISIDQLCDDNCVAILDKKQIQVFKNNNRILKGDRNPTDGLWDITLQISPPSSSTLSLTLHQSNAIIRKGRSKTSLVQYLHACCVSPVISTWKQAIKNGNFIMWPGINSLSIDAHLPKSIASAKGHLDQERKNLQSTRLPAPAVSDEADTIFPSPDTPNIKTYSACAQIVPFVPKRTACHDLTGRFPHRSSRGNEYLLTVYDYDSNGILHCPLKNKTGAEIKRGWITIHERLARAGNQPEMYILDNEASADLKKGLKKYNLHYQLVPPHLHRRNAAERAIRTYKSHLLAFLATCDPKFPVSE
jgi:hypothetical protein